MLKYKKVISTSVLISLVLIHAQEVTAGNDVEQVEDETLITEVQETHSEINEVEDDEQEVPNLAENQSNTGENPSITTSNDDNDLPPGNVETQQNEQISTDEPNEESHSTTVPEEKSFSAHAQAVKTAEEYIKDYEEAYYVSDLWTISQQFKADFPNHPQLGALINDAAANNIAEGARNHRNSNYSNAIIYYNRVLGETLINANNRARASAYLVFAENEQQIKTTDDYYEQYQKAYFVSDLWLIAQEFKAMYPYDSRLAGVMNDAATNNLAEGQRNHNKGNFELAAIYYRRVSSEDLVDAAIKNQASDLLAQAEYEANIRAANTFYKEYKDAYFVSDKWRIAQEFKESHPGDARISEVINDAAAENIKEGQRAHQRSNFELAAIYYNRVLAEDLINSSLRNTATRLLNRAKANLLYRLPDDFYKEYTDAYYVSDKWIIAKEFIAIYPSDERAAQVLNDAAINNVKEGQRAHKRDDYDLALIYYNRVLDEPLVATHIQNMANTFAAQASNRTPLKLADDYVKEYEAAYYVSDLWQISQEFKAVYPDDYRLIGIINDAAEKNMAEGQRAHNRKDYDLAPNYYSRVVGEDYVDETIRVRAQTYSNYAENKTTIKSENDFKTEFNNAYYVSHKWEIAKEFKTMYPNSVAAHEAMREAANGNLNEGRTAQRKGDTDRAIIYYNRILNEKLVDEEIRYLASVFLNQTSSNHTPVVYVDVGHGGSDPGATHFGVQEKVLNLNTSKYLKDELEKRGYIVIMSRETDQYIDLSARPYEANDLRVDAFVSVHYNSMGGSGIARGLETFIFHVVESGFGQETNHNNFLLDEPRISESLLLAEQIHSNLVRSTGLYNRGVKGNNFNVLRNSYAPAALVELGFMDNYAELSYVNNRSYQKRAAEAMAIGIDNYFKGIN